MFVLEPWSGDVVSRCSYDEGEQTFIGKGKEHTNIVGCSESAHFWTEVWGVWVFSLASRCPYSESSFYSRCSEVSDLCIRWACSEQPIAFIHDYTVIVISLRFGYLISKIPKPHLLKPPLSMIVHNPIQRHITFLVLHRLNFPT